MKKVLTVGVYDLLHIGHVNLFRRARAVGDQLVVAVQESEVVLKYKPEAKLVYTTEERMYMVKAIRYVDEVITYKAVDDIVQTADFDIFVTGPDQNHEAFQKQLNGVRLMVRNILFCPELKEYPLHGLRNKLRLCK